MTQQHTIAKNDKIRENAAHMTQPGKKNIPQNWKTDLYAGGFLFFTGIGLACLIGGFGVSLAFFLALPFIFIAYPIVVLCNWLHMPTILRDIIGTGIVIIGTFLLFSAVGFVLGFLTRKYPIFNRFRKFGWFTLGIVLFLAPFITIWILMGEIAKGLSGIH
jgi:hypothetical protein